MNVFRSILGRKKEFCLIVAFSVLALPFCFLTAQSGFFQDRSTSEELTYEEEFIEMMFSTEMPFYSSYRGDYLVAMDTFKQFYIIGNELILGAVNVFKYDEYHRLSENHSWFYSSPLGELIPRWQEFFTYDDLGVLVSDTTHSYNQDEQIWVISTYRDFEYDESGMLAKTNLFTWDTEGETWWLSRIEEREIENGNVVQVSTFDWDESGMDFKLIQYITREYENGLLLNDRLYILDNVSDTFFLQNSEYFEYNDNDLVIVHEVHRPPFGSQIIEPNHRTESEYNDDNLVIFDYRYNPVFLQTGEWGWTPLFKFEKDYTDFQSLESNVRYNWNQSVGDWFAARRELLDYDDYQSLISTHIDNAVSNFPTTWEHASTIEIDRNYDFPPGSYLAPFNLGDNGHKTLSETRWNIQPQEMIVSQTVSTYRSLAVNVHDFDGEHPIKIFPNPATETVYLSLEGSDYSGQTLQVVDMLGRIWYRGPFNSSLELEVRDWPVGVYNLVLFDSQNGLTSSRQFVKH